MFYSLVGKEENFDVHVHIKDLDFSIVRKQNILPFKVGLEQVVVSFYSRLTTLSSFGAEALLGLSRKLIILVLRGFWALILIGVLATVVWL